MWDLFQPLHLETYYLPIGLSIPIGQLSTHLGIDKWGMGNLWVWVRVTHPLPNGNVTPSPDRIKRHLKAQAPLSAWVASIILVLFP